MGRGGYNQAFFDHFFNVYKHNYIACWNQSAPACFTATFIYTDSQLFLSSIDIYHIYTMFPGFTTTEMFTHQNDNGRGGYNGPIAFQWNGDDGRGGYNAPVMLKSGNDDGRGGYN
ncbi:hypothetical protein KC318_g6231 [Hortaea werneckii]|nr:hypothetical protein KC334_g7125 [Hortaea werneckii]KAI7013406.1 hypothetical protein KC355_g5041 [Hortaea werneckii]KAI7666895.1 hypothetical protein KC318_g6231 [Hortaea werneckii]